MISRKARVGLHAGQRHSKWRHSLLSLWRKAVQTARLAVGVGDYDAYLAHMRAHHPHARAMSYAEFFNERQQKRYGNGSSRCC